MKLLYDITIPIREGIPVWPGDEAYRFRLAWAMSEGESANVGTVTMSVHTGTHADAPFHFDPAGAGIGELDLTPYVGRAVVVDVTGQAVIGQEALAGVDLVDAPRLLLKTGAWTDHSTFPESVPTLAPDVPTFLAAYGVLLVGVDVPSVDAIDSKELPIHHALDAAGIGILESLDLRLVPPGMYNLIALPLRLMGADGSPLRAILTA